MTCARCGQLRCGCPAEDELTSFASRSQAEVVYATALEMAGELGGRTEDDYFIRGRVELRGDGGARRRESVGRVVEEFTRAELTGVELTDRELEMRDKLARELGYG